MIPTDSNESHQGSRAGLWSEAFIFVVVGPHPWRLPRDCEGILGFLRLTTNLTRAAVQASGRKLFNSSSSPSFPEIVKGSQDSLRIPMNLTRATVHASCRKLLISSSSWPPSPPGGFPESAKGSQYRLGTQGCPNLTHSTVFGLFVVLGWGGRFWLFVRLCWGGCFGLFVVFGLGACFLVLVLSPVNASAWWACFGVFVVLGWGGC